MSAISSGSLTLDAPLSGGAVASIYRGAWRGEPIVVTFTSNENMVMCAVRFRPAPLLTQSISERLHRTPTQDTGDGLVNWKVGEDFLSSVHYENIAARGIEYRPPVSGTDAIGYSDNISYTRLRGLQ